VGVGAFLCPASILLDWWELIGGFYVVCFAGVGWFLGLTGYPIEVYGEMLDIRFFPNRSFALLT
jgi:hypothetical protein